MPDPCAAVQMAPDDGGSGHDDAHKYSDNDGDDDADVDAIALPEDFHKQVKMMMMMMMMMMTTTTTKMTTTMTKVSTDR